LFAEEDQVTFVGPSLLRNLLHPNQLDDWTTKSFESKMTLLSYALSDEDYEAMESIDLLPVDDGTFDMFDEKWFECYKYFWDASSNTNLNFKTIRT